MSGFRVPTGTAEAAVISASLVNASRPAESASFLTYAPSTSAFGPPCCYASSSQAVVFALRMDQETGQGQIQRGFWQTYPVEE